jgi:hypothetical protein
MIAKKAISMLLGVGMFFPASSAFSGAILERAERLLRDRTFPEVITAANHANTLEADKARTHMVYGYVMEAIGEDDKAKNAFMRAEKLEPDNLEIKMSLLRFIPETQTPEPIELLEKENRWFAVFPRYDKAFPLMADGPDDPRILVFEPNSANPKTGRLVWYAGAPGTQYLTPVVRAMIIDLDNGRWSQSVVLRVLDQYASWTWTGDVTARIIEPESGQRLLSAER